MIEHIIEARPRKIGDFPVGRVLPYTKRRMVGPFVFFDHMGPVNLPAGIPPRTDVLPHPHIGLSTITYLFDGEIMHRDSVGSEQPIRPGEVNWMVAGSGITHSERFEHARQVGDTIHGIQAWIALPTDNEEADPSFSHHSAHTLPSFEEDGVWSRLVAGEAFGARAPVRTYSPLFYLHWILQAGARAQLPADYPERAAYLVSGSVEIDGQVFEPGRLLVFAPGRPILFKARVPSELMLLGGEPVGPRFIDWNFVSSSRERIEQAKADWRAGRIKLPDLDDETFIPLPDA